MSPIIVTYGSACRSLSHMVLITGFTLGLVWTATAGPLQGASPNDISWGAPITCRTGGGLYAAKPAGRLMGAWNMHPLAAAMIISIRGEGALP
jgi:hypothetical protein